jgi:hypothetical protein
MFKILGERQESFSSCRNLEIQYFAGINHTRALSFYP